MIIKNKCLATKIRERAQPRLWWAWRPVRPVDAPDQLVWLRKVWRVDLYFKTHVFGGWDSYYALHSPDPLMPYRRFYEETERE